MESANERGQVIIESALVMGLVAGICLACIWICLIGHKQSEKYEFKTYGRKNYDQQTEGIQSKIYHLLDRVQSPHP